MLQRLQGNAFRVFRAIVDEACETVEDIRIELTQGVGLPAEEIERMLYELRIQGHLEEDPPGHWRLSPRGQIASSSLLGRRHLLGASATARRDVSTLVEVADRPSQDAY